MTNEYLMTRDRIEKLFQSYNLPRRNKVTKTVPSFEINIHICKDT